MKEKRYIRINEKYALYSVYTIVGGNKSMIQPKHNITNERAFDLLQDGQPIIDCYITREIIIETTDHWDKEIIIENCIVEYFSGSVTQFDKPVRLINCQFKKCQFVSSYFAGGLTIDNCLFDDYLDFQAGGHNKIGNQIIITNNIFKSFVNFFDCWYENEVTIKNNNFQNGTNLLGKPFNIPVTFNIDPIIESNIGKLDFDNEGQRDNE